MAAGGDGYDMFKAYPIKAEYNTLMDTLLGYVEKLGTVEGKFETRMTVLTEAPAEEETPANSVVISIMKKVVSKNGQNVTVSLFPYIEQGRVMARLRDMSELLDIELEWDNQSKTASIKGQDIEFKVNQDYAMVDGKEVDLGVKTKVEDGRVILPVAQVARMLDRNVAFDNTIKEVVIN